MPFLGTTGGGSVKQYGGQANLGYFIKNSLRFRSSANGNLSRTPASATNRQTWTWSGWVKRGLLSSGEQVLFSCGSSYTAQSYFTFYIGSDNTLVTSTGTAEIWRTTQVFRDPAAWYHMVLVVDTTQATANNRTRLYINGTEVTSFSRGTNLSQNTDYGINNNVIHYIGRDFTQPIYFDGYIGEINLIDGQALTPSSFGKTDAVTGQWIPKKFASTYGTNGFYLKFADASDATAAAIGKDSSPNGNNWTPNNISVTAGATYDSMTDVPTLTSATAANYAVSNVLDIDRSNITTSNGNLTLTKATANDSPRPTCTFGATSGKFYAEITWTSITNTTPNDNYVITGVTTKENWTDSSNGYNAVLYTAANNGLAANGQKGIWTAGSFAGSSYGTGYFVSGTVIGIALNLDAGTVTFYNNGVSQGAITLPTTTHPWFFYNTSDGTGNGYTANWNFGQQPFTYTPPSGFKSLNTYNLP